MIGRHPRRLEECHSIDDLRALARRRLPGPVFGHVDGGAEDEVTVGRNLSAFAAYGLVARTLVDVQMVSTTTSLLGQQLAWPVICAPTGASRFSHPEGELAVARAAAKSGTLYGLSTVATHSLEDVALAATGPKMFQLYIFKNRDLTLDLIERCRAAGYGALCLTVDAAVPGKRERDLKSGWGVPIRPSLAGALQFAAHPRWIFGQIRRGTLSMPMLSAAVGSDSIAAQTRFIAAELDPSIGWSDVREIAALWDGPFAIKGIMAPDDAKRAVDAGASAIIVSNHGGRQLDGALSPLDILPEIVAAIGGRAEIILEGGVRRGNHVLKALALGANACSIGRPYLYGLAAGGEAGVAKALSILREELVRSMQLAGCTECAAVDPDLVRKFA